MTEPLAHSGGHLLQTHLEKVAALAADFSQAFDTAAPSLRWAYLAGLWHDLGKYRAGFQRYIASADGESAHIEGRSSGKVAPREKSHSTAGALWAIQAFEKSHGKSGALAARVLAYLIASHHAGLYDWEGEGGLKPRLALDDSATELREALAAQPPQQTLDASTFDQKQVVGSAEKAMGFTRRKCRI